MKIEFPILPDNPEELERFIIARENTVGQIKPDNQARIVWADPENKNCTPVSVVYLHGFTASQGEGYPLHLDFAKRYGLNLYLSRLEGHGLEHPDAFSGLTAQHFVDSAVRALAAGTKLGSNVILMGTSTGASLALYLASKIEEKYLRGLILYSPLVQFYGVRSWWLSNSWARSILNMVPGGGYEVKTKIGHPDQQKVWYHRYRLKGALALGTLIEKTMTAETFARVSLPAFVGYYYKNRKKQDRTVSVSAIKKMYHSLGTEPAKKKLVNFPEAGTHVICNSLLSNSVDEVKEETFKFSENSLSLNPLK